MALIFRAIFGVNRKAQCDTSDSGLAQQSADLPQQLRDRWMIGFESHRKLFNARRSRGDARFGGDGDGGDPSRRRSTLAESTVDVSDNAVDVPK